MIEDKVVEATNKCYLCSKDISKSWFKTSSINCIVCDNLVCTNCYLNEEVFYPEKNKAGYCCKQEECLNKTRANLKVPFVDLNPVYNILETQIPNLAKELNNSLKDLVSATSNEHLPKMFEELNKNISLKLEEIKDVFEEQKSKTKDDAKELIEYTVNEKLPELLEDTNKIISSKLDEVKNIFEEQKKNTKNDITEIIDNTFKTHLDPIKTSFNKIWALRYLILILLPLGFFIFCGLITVEIIMIVRFFK